MNKFNQFEISLMEVFYRSLISKIFADSRKFLQQLCEFLINLIDMLFGWKIWWIILWKQFYALLSLRASCKQYWLKILLLAFMAIFGLIPLWTFFCNKFRVLSTMKLPLWSLQSFPAKVSIYCAEFEWNWGINAILALLRVRHHYFWKSTKCAFKIFHKNLQTRK